MSDKEPLQALIIDDEPSICESLAGVLEDEGWKVKTASQGRQGLIEFSVARPNLVFLDIWMPGLDGIAVLQAIREVDQTTPVVIMSGHATIDTAVKATKLGAFDVMEKPLELDRILSVLKQASVLREKIGVSKGLTPTTQVIGDSIYTQELRRQIAVVAPKNAWVLVTGENGTGKEIVARSIHGGSSRATKPFVAVNCAAIPEELIESELFGHEKGAFTNASVTRKGRFEMAHDGTIFLDEIGDMSLRTQAKILRILQEKVFERVGGHNSIHVDVRVIAATNKDLAAEIAAGRFREDLFYRLNVIPIKLKPLRERREDILPLARYFLAATAHEAGLQNAAFSPQGERRLQDYTWPGNVRELRNAVERAVILSSGAPLDMDELGVDRDKDGAKQVATLKDAKSDFERSYILDKLEENDWNVSRTADVLGIERSNLHRKLRAYDIDAKKLKG